MDKVGYGIIGSGFIADLHAHALRVVPEANLVAVASPTPGQGASASPRNAASPTPTRDYRELLARKDIQLVSLALPNDLHAEAAIAAARAGKHVVCEKPLCRTLAEADRMIAACKEAGVHLLYAEELLFAPKYVRAKKLVDEGALGKPFLVKQSEEHDGPHMPWFWDVERSGGGVLLDMGCHSIEFGRWVLGKPPVKSVYAQMGTYVHGDKTRGEDHSLVIIEFEGGGRGAGREQLGQAGRRRRPLRDLRQRGLHAGRPAARVGPADLQPEGLRLRAWRRRATPAATPSPCSRRSGTTASPRSSGTSAGWCMGKEQPFETGEDGREVLKIIYAAYQSAGEGRKIPWPYTPPPDVRKPIDLWKRA